MPPRPFNYRFPSISAIARRATPKIRALNMRWPFINRPWIAGKLYDDFSRSSILHCDAYVMLRGEHLYLLVDWREGGRARIAFDTYLIDTGEISGVLPGLTPVWDGQRFVGAEVHWTHHNHHWIRRVHQRVLSMARTYGSALGPRWARVVIQAHYVLVRETDTEITGAANGYAERKPYANRAAGTLPDLL